MKRTLTVNLWNQVFHIDEDAYELLKTYLGNIEKRFSDKAERKEITEDVEARIAELFNERLKSNKQVINIDDVNEVIVVIGKPDDFAEGHETKSEEAKKETPGAKRLYRDTDNAMLGGVCSGLAAYFKIDVVVTRILLVLTLLFSGPFIYIILWIVMPEAKTTAQKLEMNGEAVNLSNIEKKIKEEFKKVSENLKGNRTKDAFLSFFRAIFNSLSVIFSWFFKAFKVIFGFCIIITGLSLLIVLSAGWFINVNENNEHYIFLKAFFDNDMLIITLISLALILIIPAVSLLMSGIKIVFGIKQKLGVVNKILLIFFLFGLILAAFVAIMQVSEYRYRCISEEGITGNLPENKIYVVKIDGEGKEQGVSVMHKAGNWVVWDRGSGQSVLGVTKIQLEKSGDTVSTAVLLMECRHYDTNTGTKALKKILPVIQIEDSIITIPRYFELQKDEIFRFQKAKVIISLAEGQRVLIPENAESIIGRIDISPELEMTDISGKVCVMTSNGLEISE